jgi:Protein of unknown function (DUF3011)
MIHPSRLLLLLALSSLGISRAHSQPLLSLAPPSTMLQYGNGQNGGYDQGQVITCSSDDGKRHYCNADTRRGVRLSRQISGTPCVESQSWGYDNRGLWVDKGCRAEFSIGGGGGNNQGNWNRDRDNQGNWNGQNSGQVVTCSSDDGKRHYCNVNGATANNVFMTRQISGTACNQGDTWGVDRRGLWVDRGCRAEFSLSGRGYGNNSGYDNNRGYGNGNSNSSGRTITCSSDDGDRHFCSVNGADLSSVSLVRQISGSACNRGSTWGVDRTRGIWVDKGCRAEFQVNGYR